DGVAPTQLTNDTGGSGPSLSAFKDLTDVGVALLLGGTDARPHRRVRLGIRQGEPVPSNQAGQGEQEDDAEEAGEVRLHAVPGEKAPLVLAAQADEHRLDHAPM